MILRQRLTTAGWVGLVFFFQGPLLYWIRVALSIIDLNVGGFLPLFIAFIMLGMFFASVPLLLLGREWVIIKE